MKLGIIGAMEQEIGIIKHDLQDVKTTKIAERNFYEGKLANTQLVLTYTRVGKVAASLTATILIMHFQVDAIIFIGTAGAIADHLNIGDVIIGKDCFQHDMDPRPIFQRYEIPLTNRTIFSADTTLLRKAQKATSMFLQQELPSIIDSYQLHKFCIENPKAYLGMIASGDKFVYSPEDTKHIKEDMNGTLAAEMEGAAVAQVCVEFAIPHVIIRIISDKADHQAAIDFLAFIEIIAQQYAKGILNYILKLN